MKPTLRELLKASHNGGKLPKSYFERIGQKPPQKDPEPQDDGSTGGLKGDDGDKPIVSKANISEGEIEAGANTDAQVDFNETEGEEEDSRLEIPTADSTKREILNYLKAKGIKHNPNDKKVVLLELV